MKLKVSVIIPAYNIENYIERCIESVINQTLNEIEIIVVNDGSTDATLEVVKSFLKVKKNITIIDQKNKGVVVARNEGLKIAQGEYILFVDGDDWLEMNCLELLYNNAVENKSDIVLYNAFWASDTETKRVNTFKIEDNSEDYLKELFLGNIMPAIWGKLIKKQFIVNSIETIPIGISYAEDLALVASLFMNRPRISYLNDNLYNYYIRFNSVSRTISEKIFDIDVAMSFIEDELRRKKLFNEYEKEFEKLVFKHLFIDRIYNEEKLCEIHKKVYKQFKARKVKVLKNSYIKQEISGDPISAKLRFIVYNFSLNLGRRYDSLRNLIKLTFSN